MAYDFKKLGKSTSDNAPGLKKRVLVAPRSTFTALAEPGGAGAVAGDTIVISDPHTFGASDGFIEMYTTLATAELTAELVGERDSRTINPKVTAFHPGLYAEALEFGKMAKDEEWIVLVEQLDGSFIQLGQDGLECEITYSLGSGKVDGGSKGITFNIESFGDVFVYEGTITTKP